MSRRDELEKELDIVQDRIDNAPEDTPEDLLESYHQELDSIFVELNNLYDDYETESE